MERITWIAVGAAIALMGFSLVSIDQWIAPTKPAERIVYVAVTNAHELTVNAEVAGLSDIHRRLLKLEADDSLRERAVEAAMAADLRADALAARLADAQRRLAERIDLITVPNVVTNFNYLRFTNGGVWVTNRFLPSASDARP